MALWIFRSSVVPAEVVVGCRQLTEDRFDDLSASFWSARDGDEAARALSSLLPRIDSWSPKVSIFGHEGGDRVEVWREMDRVDGITVKIDCRSLNLELIDAVEAVALSHRLVFIYERTFEICEPGLGALRRFILSSANRRMLSDPTTWIPHLADEVQKREDRG